MTRRLRDPVAVLWLIGGALVVAGFGALVLGWRGAAGRLEVSLQMPYLVSGGIGGLALIGLGLALCNLASARREAARELRRLQDLVDDAAGLLEAAELRRLREGADGSTPTPAHSPAR
jgi:hypothetical protein